MKLFHRTDHAESILRVGFRDSEGSYLTLHTYHGVWFSDTPLDENEGAHGSSVLAVDTGDTDLDEWQWVGEGKPYREWLIPAAVANTWPVEMVAIGLQAGSTG